MPRSLNKNSVHGIIKNIIPRHSRKLEEPLRSELFSVEQMQHYGKVLATSHDISRSPFHRDRLLTRLVENAAVLSDTRAVLTEAATAKRRILPAADWLLDNFYLIEEHIDTSKRDLPKGYSRGLPRLSSGNSIGLPRVYDIALERIAHGDGLVDPDTLLGFIEAYQSVSVLTLGELWAIPIMLRLALIENLRRVAIRISSEMSAQNEAESWADRMTASLASDPKNLILVIADMARSDPPMINSFVAELARKLQGKGTALSLPLTWIEQRLSEAGLTIELLVQSAMRQQAADQVSISNSIRGLRSLSSMNWKMLVENSSVVEKILRTDPSCTYGKMDFATRDRYRHIIEKTANRANLSEEVVAGQAIRLALEACKHAGKDNRQAHVGYYLIDKGLTSLLLAVQLRPRALESSKAYGFKPTLALYLGSIGLLTAIASAGLALLAHRGGIEAVTLWAIALPILACTAGSSIALINFFATTFAEPHILPRLDFSEGVPAGSRTLVVVPSMLSDASHIDRLVDALEVRFLANRDDNILFGLLTDFQDCANQTTPLDGDLVKRAEQKIETLNEQYADKHGNPFCLFHRPRRWNASERIWMGYERKRGKLAELNALLRGGNGDGFELIIGNIKRLKSVKYVITLDTDTQLPRDCARELIGIMAHPLNHARYDEAVHRVVEGYCIVQPRVATSLPGARRSLFAMLNNSDPGLDPYTRAVSDVYQDLFDEGSFTGKGIYKVDSFEHALKGRFPENRILSHDLLEGCYARSGLASDVQLYEDPPAAYAEDVERRRRWIRGDWQIARWVLRTVPSAEGGSRENALSVLSKWKIFDNLRRSLQAPALSSLLIFGWLGVDKPLLWTIALTGLVFLPALLSSCVGVLNRAHGSPLRAHLSGAIRSTLVRLAQTSFTLACLPYEAALNLGTILRTSWRTLVTHRHLLAWKPSGERDGIDRTSLLASFRIMWSATLGATALFAALFFLRPASLAIAAPFIALWFCSPLIVWKLSRPIGAKAASITLSQFEYLGRLARKTWHFFETFVNDDENWLPPDNFQEVPEAKLAHRTSPTNIGLSLLANLTAHDLGYISIGRTLFRTERTFRSMQRLERYKNHLYNWYDTQTLQPLMPRYVSTVDSGNLSAHLLTLSAGIGELADEPILSEKFWAGLLDTDRILSELTGEDKPQELFRFRQELRMITDARPESLSSSYLELKRLAAFADSASAFMGPNLIAPLTRWTESLALQLKDAFEELEYLAPWLCKGIVLQAGNNYSDCDAMLSLRELHALEMEWLRKAREERPIRLDAETSYIQNELEALVSEGLERSEARLALIGNLAQDLEIFGQADYSFLYSKRRHLLAIGYDVDGHRRDPGHYDLLASEARIASFIAIALEEIPQENWFSLGRLLVEAKGKSLLFSWSGSMFEYLMPLLVMPEYERTLLGQTCRAAVERQIAYGRQRGVPWGISESGYNSFDLGHNYRYRAFGVPGLGLKRGLDNDLVIAPYATALALMIMPEKACLNLQRLTAEGFEGDYGLYEAIDYTATRVPSGEEHAIVRSFMAHHQAMSFISFASLLLDRPMQRRFQSSPLVRANTLLLEEKVPHASRFASQTAILPEFRLANDKLRSSARIFTDPETISPAVHILSNGRYHVMVTNTGSGYSRWNGLAVTRWTEDSTADNKGNFLFIQDVKTGRFWSNSFQPSLMRPEHYEAIFSEGRAEFRRRDQDLITYTEISVSPEDDIELRRIRIENRSKNQRTIELTSYAEVVLATPSSDAAHPGFSNLFIQTEILEEKKAILCTRRPRSHNDAIPWMVHLMNVRDAKVLEISYETNRLTFMGRGRTIASPKAMQKPGSLSGTSGSVLDPIVAIRQRIVIDPDSTATIDLVIGMADSREKSAFLIDRYQDKHFANRAFELARTHSQVILQQINGTEADAQLYSQLASYILYAQATLRAESSVIEANRRGQAALWGHSISGDIPIVLLKIKDPANIELIRQLVQAHAYWRQKGLAVDLLVWNEERGGYQQQLQNQILGLITANDHANIMDRSGGIFVRSADQIAAEDRTLIQAAARVIISDGYGSLEEQIGGRLKLKAKIPSLLATRPSKDHPVAKETNHRELLFPNGYGGFSPDGREYIITLDYDSVTPAPWVNILANPFFGTVVSEAGMAYTWCGNAHEFRVTPWHDDPVCDTSGEAMYIRDEENGEFWSPTPLPRKGETPYLCRHGFGYSVFEHSEHGISTELWIYVARDAPVKFLSLKVKNESGRPRRLSATAYAQLVLGELASKSSMHVVTELDEQTGALFARNWYNTEFSGRVVFLDAIGKGRTITGDRTEFIGRNRDLGKPEAMSRACLSGRTGAALDPCAAIQIPFDLADGQSYELVFRLGSGRDSDEAACLIKRYRGPGEAKKALEAVWEYWNSTLGAVQVETPDLALNVLANGWLIYQVLSSRMWGRSGYYQSGGAFGFRDQLQDAMALIHVEPDLLRSQILLCAGRQFPEGDVQHWWHPPAGRGSRTRCSDDFLWLALASCRYIESTGDKEILGQIVPYIEGRPLGPEEESYYDLPEGSALKSNVYEHCVRAIKNGMRRGMHGLPLMGSGDWNDGMNMVGEKGEGESVWLAFFQYEVLTRFSDISLLNNDRDFSAYCLREAAKLITAIEQHAWDGAWYRRAYFDDGTPLGSAKNNECRIDSISQSWSVLSGAGSALRSSIGMDSMYRHLVSPKGGLIRLLEPPFDVGEPNPGYIQGYVPGVRENGGQYTHAAIWAIMAFAKLGNTERAWELFTMINPVNHSKSPEAVETYMVEPYVMPADIYSLEPHTGRGGWTWYTGSASWMYRLILESLLGLSLVSDKLHIEPKIPNAWNTYTIRYRYRQTLYIIRVRAIQAQEKSISLTLDGLLQTGDTITLVDDHAEHQADLLICRLPYSKEGGNTNC